MNATERLAQSRERLRQALRPPAARQRPVDPSRQAYSSPDWLQKLRSAPAMRLVMTVWQSWWARQPARVALTLAAQTGMIALVPVAQKHPFKLVLGAAAVGGALAWVRPWRWIPTTALLAGLIPALMTQALKQRSDPS